jgi:hypothetical protein
MPTGLQQRLSLIVSMSNRAALAGIHQLRGALGGLTTHIGGMSAQFRQWGETATQALKMVGIAGVGALGGLIAISRTFIQVAMQQQSALIGLGSIATSYGVSADAARSAAKGLENEFIDVGSAAQALKNLLAAGLSMDKAILLIQGMTEQSIFNRQAHYSVAEAVIAATEGIRNENSILSDATGTTRNLAKMYEEYGKQIGVSYNEMTKAQKAEAAFIGFSQEAQRSVGDLTKALGAAQGQQASFGKTLLDVRRVIGDLLLPVYGALLSTITPYLQQVKLWVTAHRELLTLRLREWLEQIVAGLRSVIEYGQAYGKLMLDWILQNKGWLLEMGQAIGMILLLVAALGKLSNPVTLVITAIVLLVTQSTRFREVLGELAEFINAHRELLLVMFGGLVVTQVLGNLGRITTGITTLGNVIAGTQVAGSVGGIMALGTALGKLREALLLKAIDLGATGTIFGYIETALSGPLLGAIGAIGVGLTLLWSKWRSIQDDIERQRKVMEQPAIDLADIKRAIEAKMLELYRLPSTARIAKGSILQLPITVSAENAKSEMAAAERDLKAAQERMIMAQAQVSQTATVVISPKGIREGIPGIGPEAGVARERLTLAQEQVRQAEEALTKARQISAQAAGMTIAVPEGMRQGTDAIIEQNTATAELTMTNATYLKQLALLKEAIMAKTPTAEQQAILHTLLTDKAAVMKALAFTPVEAAPAKVATQGATALTKEQIAAVERLRQIQAQAHLETMTGMAKELEQIRLKRESMIQELGEAQQHAGQKITLAQNTVLAEQVAQRSRQTLYEETTKKIDDLLAQVAEAQEGSIQRELAQINRVRDARKREFGELLADLTVMLPATQEATQALDRLRKQGVEIPLTFTLENLAEVIALIKQLQAKQIEIPVFLKAALKTAQLKAQAPKLIADMDVTAVEEAGAKVKALLKDIGMVGLTESQVELRRIEEWKIEELKKLDLLERELRLKAAAGGAAGDAAQRILRETNLTQGRRQIEQKAAEDSRRLTTSAWREEQEIRRARLEAWAQQSAAHTAMAAGMAAGWGQLMQGMEQLGAAFFENQRERHRQEQEASRQLVEVRALYDQAVQSNNVTAQTFYQAEIQRLTALQNQTLAFGQLATAVWKGFASAGLEAIAAVLKAYAQIYAVKAAEALITGQFWRVAQYTGLVAAASAGAGLLSSMAQQQQRQAMEVLQPQAVGQRGGVAGGSVVQAPQGTSFAAVTVQKEPNITIAPQITIDAGHDVFIGAGSVEEFKASIARVSVEAIQDAIATGQIRVGRG